MKLKPIHRTVYDKEYGHVVLVRREGKPAWVLGMPCIIKGRLGIWRNLEGRARRVRGRERGYRDLVGVKRAGSKRTPSATLRINRRHAANHTARLTRAGQQAAQARKRRARQKRHA